MDKPLPLMTPTKIQRLIHLAEDRSYTERRILTEDEVNEMASQVAINQTPKTYESSSGILDLEHVVGFGESVDENVSLCQSTNFNAREMTGRSTGTDEVNTGSALLQSTNDGFRRYTMDLKKFTHNLEMQSDVVNDIMSHSIATNYSFHSKRDITADEVSFMRREGNLPPQGNFTYITETESTSNSNKNLSVGAYFKKRCPDFGKVLPTIDSRDKMHSITEVSLNNPYYDNSKEINTLDDTLDSLPVRQPNIAKTVKVPNQQAVNVPSTSKLELGKTVQSSLRLVTEESTEDSLSISKIADYIGKQSIVSVTDMLQLHKKKHGNRNQPLTELHMNNQERNAKQEQEVINLICTKKADAASSSGPINTAASVRKQLLPEMLMSNLKRNANQVQVADLINSKKAETASSAHTVMSVDNTKGKGVPEVIITRSSLESSNKLLRTEVQNNRDTRSRSKSPSTKSQLPASTVREHPSSFDSTANSSRADSKIAGVQNVNPIAVETQLRKMDLSAVVGCAQLTVNIPNNKMLVSNESTNITVSNTGPIAGIWNVKTTSNTERCPFHIDTTTFELRPGAKKTLKLIYKGPGHVNEVTLIFEEITTKNKTTFQIFGATEKPVEKVFPVRTNHKNLSWVKPGRKEISLKNSTDRKIHMRCQILGEGFSLDLPGVKSREERGISLPFMPFECRQLPILFAPNSLMPCKATLHLVYDKNDDFSRKVTLHGCGTGEAVRWSGLVTYSDTALLRAAGGAPVDLNMYNKSPAPAFVAARLHFNPQFRSLESSSRLVGARRVVCGRARHAVSLRVDWARVERCARDAATSALATITVLTGAEVTRRRILRILKSNPSGELDTTLLPEHLRLLAEPLEGEDDPYGNLLDFEENKESLSELICGVQELTAHIDLPQDFGDEQTIIITDDTVVDHHTLCE